VHFHPITTKSLRIRFKMDYVSLDELELFGMEERDVNLARNTWGTKVSSSHDQGTEDRNPVDRVNDGEFGTMTWRAAAAKDSQEKPWLRFDFEKPVNINRLRLSSNREYFYDTDYLEEKSNLPRYEFELEVLEEDGSWKPRVGTWYVNKQLSEDHPVRSEVLGKIQDLIATLAEEGPRPSFVARFVEPTATHVLMRGSPESPRDEVIPAGPVALGGELGLTSQAGGSKRRADFAKWVSSGENPLTARVMVNRIWHHVFGRGIVSTTTDFGKAGAAPTHPELLDWLAAEFVEPSQPARQPWSMKSMIKMLVMSQAFRQSSAPTDVGIATDAGAELLWRFPPQRIEAEVIRDSILQASGSLDRTMGGRSYRIHNEKKTYAQWEVLDNHGPQTWRRMLYQERMRRVDDGIFTAFDFPDCGQVRAKRPVSTTPLQALSLMNSDFVIEQSNLIAGRAMKNARGDTTKAIDECFQLLLGRDPAGQEREDCLKLMNDGDLSLVCRALINSNEFAFLP
jgi:Protein of unknown function (DUF1553)